LLLNIEHSSELGRNLIKLVLNYMMNFNEHGVFEVASDQQIIFYKIIGSWNEQASLKCIAQLNKYFFQQSKQAMIMLVDTQTFEGGTPEGYKLWSEASQYWFKNNLSAFIRIDDPNSIHYKLFVEKQDRALQKAIPIYFASNLNKAIQMANKLGFKGAISTKQLS